MQVVGVLGPIENRISSAIKESPTAFIIDFIDRAFEKVLNKPKPYFGRLSKDPVTGKYLPRPIVNLESHLIKDIYSLERMVNCMKQQLDTGIFDWDLWTRCVRMEIGLPMLLKSPTSITVHTLDGKYYLVK